MALPPQAIRLKVGSCFTCVYTSSRQSRPCHGPALQFPGIWQVQLEISQVHGRRMGKARASGTHSLTLQAKSTMETQAMLPQTSITTTRRSAARQNRLCGSRRLAMAGVGSRSAMRAVPAIHRALHHGCSALSNTLPQVAVGLAHHQAVAALHASLELCNSPAPLLMAGS